MKAGDRVFVNWPTGRGGPYKILDTPDDDDVLMWVGIDNEQILVKINWCEPAETEIENGRLYYVDSFRYRAQRVTKIDKSGWEYEDFQPVHRRWDELTHKEKMKFESYMFHLTDREFTIVEAEAIYRKVYYIITGEEHP